ncbi:transposable element Tc1 transposase [Trichonephila clavipes]|nr:transposable element Tc1 transposase [Trichonephila clavipes]
MNDNATYHRTLAVQNCLYGEGIQRLVWPARSPDLNPIENVWDALGRQVAGRNYPPTNKNTLIRALTEERDKLPQLLLDDVVQSMSRPLLRRGGRYLAGRKIGMIFIRKTMIISKNRIQGKVRPTWKRPVLPIKSRYPIYGRGVKRSRLFLYLGRSCFPPSQRKGESNDVPQGISVYGSSSRS